MSDEPFKNTWVCQQSTESCVCQVIINTKVIPWNYNMLVRGTQAYVLAARAPHANNLVSASESLPMATWFRTLKVAVWSLFSIGKWLLNAEAQLFFQSNLLSLDWWSPVWKVNKELWANLLLNYCQASHIISVPKRVWPHLSIFYKFLFIYFIFYWFRLHLLAKYKRLNG